MHKLGQFTTLRSVNFRLCKTLCLNRGKKIMELSFSAVFFNTLRPIYFLVGLFFILGAGDWRLVAKYYLPHGRRVFLGIIFIASAIAGIAYRQELWGNTILQSLLVSTPFLVMGILSTKEKSKIIVEYTEPKDINDVINDREDTQLIVAAREGSHEEVLRLLSAGAKPEIKNAWGNTAMDVALKKGNNEIVELLKLIEEEFEQQHP